MKINFDKKSQNDYRCYYNTNGSVFVIYSNALNKYWHFSFNWAFIKSGDICISFDRFLHEFGAQPIPPKVLKYIQRLLDKEAYCAIRDRVRTA